MDSVSRLWVRPGITFWKENINGELKYIMCDYTNLRIDELNEAGFEALKLMNGKLTFIEICQRLSLESGSSLENVRELLQPFLMQMVREHYLMSINPQLLLDQSNEELERFYKEKTGFYPKLGLIYYELTHRCNLRCSFCYNPSLARKDNELSLKDGLRAIKELGDAGLQVLIFTGGEPLLEKSKLLGYASLASKLGITCQLFTNGTLVTGETAKKMKSAGIKYARVSIHGSNPETHDSLTGVKGAHKKALKGIENLIKNGIKVCWSATLNKRNFNEAGEMLKKALSIGCHGFRVGTMEPFGLGKFNEKEILSPEEEWAEYIFLDEAIAKYGNKIKIGWGADWCMEESWEKQVLSPKNPKIEDAANPLEFMDWYRNSLCGVGVRSCAMTADGHITPCPVLSAIKVGHILRNDLVDIWLNNEIFKVFRQRSLDNFEHCGECGMRYICAGGCRASAFLRTGSLTGKDVRRCNAMQYLSVKGSNLIRELVKDMI